jgi:hypothetical protein
VKRVVGSRVLAAASVALAVIAMTACSPADVKNPAAPADASVTDGGLFDAGPSTACGDEARARCNKLEGCSAAYLENRYGNLTTCLSINTAECVAGMNAAGSAQTAAQIEGCAAAINDPNTWSCDDYIFAQNVPTACATPAGALADGAPCLVAGQCQSTFCSIPTGGTCGVCAPPLQLHDSCATNNCPAALVCESTTKTCETYSQLGASCGPGAPCAVGLTCTAGANGSTCQSGAQTSGMPCVFGGPGCSFEQGLVCDIASATCVGVGFGAPGAACGQVGPQQAYCLGGSCIFGNCVAYGMPEQPCSFAANAATCITGTRCVTTADGGITGTCQVIGQGSCP